MCTLAQQMQNAAGAEEREERKGVERERKGSRKGAEREQDQARKREKADKGDRPPTFRLPGAHCRQKDAQRIQPI